MVRASALLVTLLLLAVGFVPSASASCSFLAGVPGLVELHKCKDGDTSGAGVKVLNCMVTATATNDGSGQQVYHGADVTQSGGFGGPCGPASNSVSAWHAADGGDAEVCVDYSGYSGGPICQYVQA